ncbi:endonuclease/exonuclease/phosphatase family protein [Nonomuraea sp. NPDC050643]|uniref:endonuclease/exonuclease/phosphatase family protein n=1 Tax=Nonomuraea sp. NPDC050643 TaxID=3155660 RepID=UPI0033F55FEF
MTTIRVGSYNIHNGGVDRGSDARLKRQLGMLSEQGLDLLGVQEAKHWGRDHGRLRYEAEQILGMRSALVKSRHHGCHLVIFIRPGRLRIIEARHVRGRPYWHAVACLRLALRLDGADGDEREIEFENGHLAPASPATRQTEAEAWHLLLKGSRAVIAVGDFNAAALHDPALQIATKDPIALRKLDTGPAQALADAGLHDVGALLGNTAPTVKRPIPYRCDRIYTTRPTWAQTFEIHPTRESDHPLLVATFAVPRE